MKMPTIIQGRVITAEDTALVRELTEHNPSWSRYRLSRELAERWNWRNGNGQLKDIACRSLLRKLDALGLIELPAPRALSPNRFRHLPVRPIAHDTTPISEALCLLQPLRLLDATAAACSGLFAWLLARYHYLSFRQPVGENMAYLAVDRHDRPLACLLFGSAAWSCAARDHYIGWSSNQRRERLHLLTNNHRLLILPWVRVPRLASHLLALAASRISQDWQRKYGHPILMLETFVESRFQGTCYRAANWRRLGQTTGRTRNGRHVMAPIKDIYVYCLHGQALRRLGDG
jgi:hypothetical protein